MRRSPFALLIAIVIVVAAGAQAIASTATDSQANKPQIAGDAGSDSTARFPTNKQNEPTVAIAPDGTNAIAGSNDEQKQPACGAAVRASTPDDCSFFPNVGTSGVYTSGDAGTTWANQGLLPGYTDAGTTGVAGSVGALPTSVAPGTLVSDGDPVVVFGPKRDTNGTFSWTNGTRAYYANLSSFSSAGRQGQQAPELLAVSISDDLGFNWFDPIIAARSHGFVFNDKEDIWADRNEQSPFFGRVYVTWTQFRDVPGFAEPVMFAFSADGGLTWSRPNQLSIAQNIAFGGRQGSVVRSGPDGTVYAIWEDSDLAGAKQVVQVSHDGGLTWSKSITIGRVKDLAAAIPGSNFRTDSFATAAVDQRAGGACADAGSFCGRIYVSWADAASGSGRIVVASSSDHGQTWSTPLKTVSTSGEGYAFFQGLDVAPNGRVDIGYQALKVNASGSPTTFGTGNATINSWYTSSTDGGATWAAPTPVSSAGSDPAASAQNNLELQFWGDYNTLASTNATALFIYTDTRNGVGCADVDKYQHSLDGTGASFAKPAPGTVCPAQFGNSDVYVSKITP